MNRLAALAALGLALLACDASNPVAPVAPADGGAGVSAGAGSSAACKTEAVAEAEGAAFFSQASASRNNLVLTVTIRLETTRTDSLSIGSIDDKAFIVLDYTGSGTASVSTGLGYFEDTTGRRTQQCTLQLNSKAAVALRPGDEIGEAQILARLGELSVTPQGVPIREAPEPLAADFLAEPSGLTVIFTDLSTGEPDLFSWAFGDGTCVEPGLNPAKPSTDCPPEAGDPCCEPNPVHDYAMAREYVVKLRVGRSGDSSDDTVSKFVTVGAELELVADFTFDAGSGSGLTVIFTDASKGNPDTWAWNFGNVGSSTEQNPIFEFPAPGEYPVTLTVTKAGLDDSSTSKLVEVGKEIGALEAKFSATTAEGSLTVQFVNESTGGPTSFAWAFGDDPDCNLPDCSQSSEENPIHTYAFSGEYIVTLEVTDDGGNTDLASEVIQVDSGEVRPVARFSFEKLGNLRVKFTDESENEPTAWEWDFDDGSCPGAAECDNQNPSHKFPAADVFEVTLTASNGAGSDSITETVDLTPLEADFSFRQSECSGVFTNETTGATNAAVCEWDFGDGNSETDDPCEPEITHDYEVDDACPFGDYQVRLTVTDSELSDTVIKTITIAPF